MDKKENLWKRIVQLHETKDRIKSTIYADSYGESKEDVLQALNWLIEKRTLELWELA